MSVVGCYTLDLYCMNSPTGRLDGENRCKDPKVSLRNHPAQFFGPDYRDCRQQAVRAGWRFTKNDDDVKCKWCAKE
jgi:hypothetical protein